MCVFVGHSQDVGGGMGGCLLREHRVPSMYWIRTSRLHGLNWVWLYRFSLVFVEIMVLWPAGCKAGRMSEAASTSSQGTCPLDFSVLQKFPYVAQEAKSPDQQVQCLALNDGLEMVQAEYLRQTGFFLVPNNTASDCVQAYESELQSQGVTVNLTSLCNYYPYSLARGHDNCQGIQSDTDLVRLLPASLVANVNSTCNGVLASGNNQDVLCSACLKQVLTMSAKLQTVGNGSTVGCHNYSSIYAGGVANRAGPVDPNTATCLFFIRSEAKSRRSLTILYIAVGAGIILLLSSGVALFVYLRFRQRKIAERKAFIKRNTDMLEGSMRPDGGLVWFTMEEIKAATHNFAREAIIGSGGFGNVYKGVLPDGSEIAVKRFKNCSPAGDAEFVHEVQMISSVRHRHLVGLKGCCVDSGGVTEGHQRIIVYEFVRNGSLYDFLFNPKKPSLDWPTRQKIATGMAKGIHYLHHGAEPAIIHRDIKASNILLDADFNAQVADFGLAKFTPEGMTHMTTQVAGTFGYVAPEYALYGQLTERSDVYSFGVVLLELISGRKALTSPSSFTLITDWAWALVKSGNWSDVVDERMEQKGPAEDMERFVLVALLCAHPQVACRPTIYQALSILENDQQLPPIPDRGIPLTSDRGEIESVVGKLSSDGGFQSFTSSESSLAR